jgi:hypothetical protein
MTQKSVNTGDNNTVVQVEGSNNTVNLGSTYSIKLTRYESLVDIDNDLGRLSPYTLFTPLIGREQEISSLNEFLEDDRSLLVRVITGDGGTGKTRLALELCEQANSRGWDAGFASRSELHKLTSGMDIGAWEWKKPTLIVVDYAAQHADLLRRWLDDLTERTTSHTIPLRMLLLERKAGGAGSF